MCRWLKMGFIEPERYIHFNFSIKGTWFLLYQISTVNKILYTNLCAIGFSYSRTEMDEYNGGREDISRVKGAWKQWWSVCQVEFLIKFSISIFFDLNVPWTCTFSWVLSNEMFQAQFRLMEWNEQPAIPFYVYVKVFFSSMTLICGLWKKRKMPRNSELKYLSLDRLHH